jgi:hypothetical protein
MSIVEQAPSYVRAISPYIPGKPITELARQMGIPVEKIVKLASNENPLGMSPKARKAVEAALAGIERYPDQFDLIAAIAERHGVAQEQVVLGNGSNDVLDLAARVFLAPGRSAVFSRHAFAVYPLATMSAGAECIAAPAKNYGHDPAAMLAAIRPDTHVVWIANPNNPTGNFLPQAEVRAFIEKIPRTCLRGARRGLYRIPGAGRPCRHGGLDQGLSRTCWWCGPSPRSMAWRVAHRLRRRAQRGDRPAEPRAPALQREQPGAGRRHRRARRPRVPRPQLRVESQRHGADHRRPQAAWAWRTFPRTATSSPSRWPIPPASIRSC